MQSVSAYSRCIHLIYIIYIYMMYTSRRWLTVSVCRLSGVGDGGGREGHGLGSNARLLLISRFVTCGLHNIIMLYCTGEYKKYILTYCYYDIYALLECNSSVTRFRRRNQIASEWETKSKVTGAKVATTRRRAEGERIIRLWRRRLYLYNNNNIIIPVCARVRFYYYVNEKVVQNIPIGIGTWWVGKQCRRMEVHD